MMWHRHPTATVQSQKISSIKKKLKIDIRLNKKFVIKDSLTQADILAELRARIF